NLPAILSRLGWLGRVYFRAKEIIEKEKCNIITTQDPFEIAFIALLLKRKYKIGLNIQMHGDYFSTDYWRDENIINLLRFYLGRYLIKQADSIRVVSNRIKKSLIKRFSVAEEKIINVPIYSDTYAEKYYSAQPEIKKKYKDNFLFLAMGRFTKEKNFPLLIDAFKEVHKKHSKARLLIIGRGPLSGKLNDLVKTRGLLNEIRFMYWVDKVFPYYKVADAYVLSSSSEGWSMAIVEAASVALPIIMTDVGLAGEVIKNESSGLIVPVGDKSRLVDAMIKIMEHKEIRDNLGQAGKEATERLLNKQETLSLYKESWQKAML
ncbi:glycosyltransferase, partial [bacterium]|nr:glycosyltransferase [bacterium]